LTRQRTGTLPFANDKVIESSGGGTVKRGNNVKQLIEYFDRAYIINLVDRPDRRRQVQREFRLAGINIPNEKVQFYTAFRPADKGRFHSVGVRGCFTSRRNVLELANR
jgi:glycosyl transferase, family 25